MVIDGHSLMYRAFYALPMMNDEAGRPTNAVYGFFSMLLKALGDFTPTHLAVAFDLHEPTFRHEQYEQYKAGRKPMPEELIPQFDLARGVLKAMGCAIVEQPGYEADDVLGTLSLMAEGQGAASILITGDRDALQLVSDLTHVGITHKGITQIEEYDPALLREKYNLRPDQIPDLKGLMGDSSDNIPGIPGIGEKTALTLLGRFETIENLLAHTEELKGKQKEKVEQHADLARFSRQLATIDRAVPLTATWTSLSLPTLPNAAMADALEALDIRSLAARVRPAEQAEPAVEPEVVEGLEQLEALVATLGGEVAVYLGKDLTLATADRAYRIPLMQDLISPGLEPAQAVAALQPLMQGPADKVLHDAKGWMTSLAAQGIGLAHLGFDTQIAAYLLDASGGRYDLDTVLQKKFHRPSGPCPAADVLQLAQLQRQELEKQHMHDLYFTMELPLIGVLWRMEREGFTVDREQLAALGEDMQTRIDALAAAIHEAGGGDFNIQSTKQLGEVLFERLGLPVIKKTKTGYSTDISVLEALLGQHPIIEDLIQYRQLTKLKSTYVDGLLPQLDPSTGKVHTRFNQTGTATGRLSSADPNLQNIPVREAEGRLIRKVFVASSPEHVLVDADYSQIELRILAHMSGDPRLIQAFQGQTDIHAQTASEVFDVPLADMTPELRSAAKAVNFGIIYGISDFGLSRQLGIPRKQAADYIQKYLETYHNVKGFMERVIDEGRAQGYVETLFGRRRPMAELKARDYNTRTGAERMAMNAPIQGTAADIIKLAMVKVDAELVAQKLKARLILQVHDELIVDSPKAEAAKVAALLTRCMQDVVRLSVPLVVDVHEGYSWFEAK